LSSPPAPALRSPKGRNHTYPPLCCVAHANACSLPRRSEGGRPAGPRAAQEKRRLPPIQRGVGLGLIAAIGWLFMLSSAIIFRRYLGEIPNGRRRQSHGSRRAHTGSGVTPDRCRARIRCHLSVMLMTFPTIKHIGISLLASAGLAGLVIGTAMKSFRS
jgi:hypothetical protein